MNWEPLVFGVSFSTIGFDAAQYAVEVLLFYAPIG